MWAVKPPREMRVSATVGGVAGLAALRRRRDNSIVGDADFIHRLQVKY